MLRVIMPIATLLILRGAAFAQEAPAPAVASQLLEHLVEIIAAALGALLLLLVKKAITFVEAKTKIDIPAKTEEMLYDWASRGVSYAEEKAHQVASKTTIKGPEKLELALGFAMKLAEEHKLDQLAKEKLVKYIEAHLGTTRTNP